MTIRKSALGRPSLAWRRAAPICASIAAHAGVGFCVLATLDPAGGVTQLSADGAGAGAVFLTLVHDPSTAATAPASRAADAAPGQAAVDGSVSSTIAPRRLSLAAAIGDAASPLQVAAAATSAQAPLDAVAQAALSTDYQRRLLEHIRAFRRFPDDATREGAGGVVQLAFQIDRRGRVLGVSVSKSSGWRSLDAAAIDTVRRAAPLPPIPSALPDAMTVTLPVEFGQS